MLKTVSLQEANSLLPFIYERFLKIQFLLTRIQYLKEEFIKRNKLNFIFDQRNAELRLIEKKIINNKSLRMKKELRELKLMTEIELSEVSRYGVIIKSLIPPHIDFLSTINGSFVYLCWHGKEEEISHFHGLDDRLIFREVIKKDKSGPLVVH